MASPVKRGEDKFVLALASGHSVKISAEMAGISESTGHKWLVDDHEVRQRVQETRDQLFREVFGRLVTAGSKAVDTLVDLLDSESDTARLGAARTILEQTHRARENVELEARLGALEAIHTQHAKVA